MSLPFANLLFCISDVISIRIISSQKIPMFLESLITSRVMLKRLRVRSKVLAHVAAYSYTSRCTYRHISLVLSPNMPDRFLIHRKSLDRIICNKSQYSLRKHE